MSHNPQSTGYRPVRLLTNAFEITQLPTKTYYQYDVFTPDPNIRKKKIEVLHHLQTSVAPNTFNPRVIYDGSNIMFASHRLRLANNGNGSFIVKLGTNTPVPPDTRGAYQVTLTLTTGGDIQANHVNDLIVNQNMQSNRALVATNLIQLIMRQGPNMHNTNNGRAYFTGQEKKVLPNSGLELWRGVFQSVRPTMGRMILNVDTCTAAVYQSGPLIDLCFQLTRKRTPQARDLEIQEDNAEFKKLERFLKGLRMKVKTGGGKSRIKTIRGLIARAGEYRFYNDKADQEMTVAQYFHHTYNMPVRYPRMIGVRLTGKKNPQQDIVPLEFCEIEHGQLFRRKIPEDLTSEMVRFSTLRPQERLKRIQDAAVESGRSEFVSESGMRISTNPIGVEGKLLNSPAVFFKPDANPLSLKDGGWNAVNQWLTDPKEMRYWMVVSFLQVGIDVIRNMISNGLGRSCSNLRMRVDTNPFIEANGNGYAVERTMSTCVSRYMQQLAVPQEAEAEFCRKLMVIVLLPQNSPAIRSAVKFWGDVQRGILTQCLREGKVLKANDQYWNNIVLKLNARLGGTNFFSVSPALAELKKAPFMIMGADVGHPGPGVQKPSVTSLVYSHDMFATQYVALTGVQSPRVEPIQALRKYVAEALDSFGAKNNAAPARIIFYRDGISEGEFKNVSDFEIGEIKAAFKDVWVKRRLTAPFPLLTFIVVGKRHHAVFFPSHSSEADRTGNSRAGSLVDSGITHPVVRDFYLQSHAAIQGTCRSSHYVILLDENWNNDMRKIQELSYTLCHVYAKATRSVSIPAPVYYADLVCSRGQFHIDPSASVQFVENDNASTTSSGTAPLDMTSWESAFRPVHPRLSKSMYFL